MSSAYRERQDKTNRYGGQIISKGQILQQLDTNIAVTPCKSFLRDFQKSNQQSIKGQSQFETHIGNKLSPFKRFTDIKKTPGKKTIIGVSDSVVDLGNSENYYSNSQETNLSSTEASFTSFLLKQQQQQQYAPLKHFNISEAATNLNQQQVSRNQRQVGSVSAKPQIIQKKITEIPYVSYRPYPQQQQISSPIIRHNSVYVNPLIITNRHSNENQYHGLYPQQKQSQHQQMELVYGLQQAQHHQQHEYNHCAKQYAPLQCQNQNKIELGRNSSAGSLLTFNGYDNSADDNLTLLNNSSNSSRDSNETENNLSNNSNSNMFHHKQQLKIEPQKTQFSQFQLQQHEELQPSSSRNKRNHSMYAPSSNFNLEKQTYLAHSNNNLLSPQAYPQYSNKSQNNIGYSHVQNNQYFDPKTQPQQQYTASRSCSPYAQQYYQCINYQQDQNQQIPTSPIRRAYVQSSNTTKNLSPIPTPSKHTNRCCSPNLCEIFKPNMTTTNNQFPSTNQTGLFGQYVTGSTVLQESSNMCQSSLLQSSNLFKNSIPQHQECLSNKSSNTLPIGSDFGSIKQDKSGFLNTQSSFINGFIQPQGPSQAGIFGKCPQLQKIIDDLKDNIVKDLENLSHKLQTESDAFLLNQINQPFQQQYRQQQQEQVGDLDLGEYSLGNDKKVRFSFSGREVIAQISATNQLFNNKIQEHKDNILSTFTTPMFQTSTLSPIQQQIIASEIIANLPYDRLPNSESLSTPRNPLESNSSSYLPTFSSPQREIIQIRQREAFVSQDIVQTAEMRKQEDKLFEQFFKSQNEEEKKDEEEDGQQGNSFENAQYGQNSNKSLNTTESEIPLGKITPQFESSKTNISQKNSLTQSDKSLNQIDLPLNSPVLQSSNNENTQVIEGYSNEVQSIAQNIPNAVSKNEHLFSDHDDVVLRTDNTDQMSESSPKLTRLWDSKTILKSIIPLQLISGKTACGFSNPTIGTLALDDIKEQYEIESADSTPTTQPIKKASDKTLQIKTSLAEVKEQILQEDSCNNPSVTIDVCPSYRGSTKSNSSQSSSSGAGRRYQDFSSLVQQTQKQERNQQIQKNNPFQGNLLPNNMEVNFSSNKSGSSKASLTQTLQNNSSFNLSGYSCNSSSSNSNGSDQSLGKTQMEEKRISLCVEKGSVPPSSRTTPSSSTYTPPVRFSTYLKQHQEDQSSTPRIISSQSQQETNQNGKNQVIGQKIDTGDTKPKDSDQGFFERIQQRNNKSTPNLEAYSLSSSSIPNIYESTQKLIKDSGFTVNSQVDQTQIQFKTIQVNSKQNHDLKDNICSDQNDVLLNSEETQCSNSQTIMAECTPEKKITPIESDNSNVNKNEEDSSQGHKTCSLPPKAPRLAIIIAEKDQYQQSKQQQDQSLSQQKQDNNSSQKKKVKMSLELKEEDTFLNKSEFNSKKGTKNFAFDQSSDVRRNLSSELNSESDKPLSSSLQNVSPLQKKDNDQIHLLKKQTSLEQDIQVKSTDEISQQLLFSSESSSMLNIPQSETGPSFSKSQSHPLLMQNNHLKQADAPPCEITISISNKNSSMNQSKTILKNSLIGSSYSSLTRLNAGNSVKKSQRRISFKDNIETVNIFEPDQKELSSRSPNSKILVPRLKSRQEFKKEPYFNPIKKFPGIQGNPTFLQQYSNSESSSLDVSLIDDKSPQKSNSSFVFDVTPRNTHHIRGNSSQVHLELGKNDHKTPQLNTTLHEVTPTKQTLFKPLNFTPSGGCSGKTNKQTKLSFLEYSKIAKQQDQKE